MESNPWRRKVHSKLYEFPNLANKILLVYIQNTGGKQEEEND